MLLQMINEIYSFTNYKKFLMTRIRQMPGNGRGELSRIAKKLQTSSVAISQIIRGDRNLTHEQALEVADHFSLGELETEYFLLLVSHERAGTHKLKRHLSAQISKLQDRAQTLKARVPSQLEMNESARNQFYSQWYYSGVRLLTSIDGQNSVPAIAKMIGLPEGKIREILEFLLRYGLCIEENGNIQMGPRMTHLEATSPLVSRHHTNWRLKGIENMENLGPDELFYTGPMTLSLSSIKKIKTTLTRMIENVAKEVAASPSEQLACLNIDWFRVKR
jgi:uncharacterized protein (TIGR02147 family)